MSSRAPPGSNAADTLLQSLPERLLLLRRDGTVLAHNPGQPPAALQAQGELAGGHITALWGEDVGGLLLRLARKAIVQRAAVEAVFQEGGRDYEVRASACGPDRAICVIRTALPGVREEQREEGLESSAERRGLRLDRRGFLRRLREALSMAILRERPLSVAVVHLDGLVDVARLIDAQLSEQILSAVLEKLVTADAALTGAPPLFIGQQSDGCIALAFECAEPDTLDELLARACERLREPIDAGGGTYHLTPYAGAVILGQETVSARTLIDRAHAAAAEARSASTQRPVFFSQTASRGARAQLDAAHELREAIEKRDIRLRYVGRHDLATGGCAAWVGYVRWLHPLRGEIRPIEFLRVAETTGLATELSRAVLHCLREDCTTLRAQWGTQVQISFGALRHHVLHEDFLGDIERFLADSALPAQDLELRIAERTLPSCAPKLLQSLRQLGVQLVVDEVARDMGSLDQLARAPLWGLQLDRAWVTAVRHDEVALKVCRAGIAMASGLGLTPIATGVDDPELRDTLLALGCRLGSGDLYANGPSLSTTVSFTAGAI
jgi:EAL domain-containing protein (putative c-di-GMP-specific phosphodiesterase class I)/GGDEF domain-containing protein